MNNTLENFKNTHFALKEPSAAAVIPGFAATATTFGSMLMNISRDIFNRWTHQIDTHRHRECALEHTGLHLNVEGIYKLAIWKKDLKTLILIKSSIFSYTSHFIQIVLKSDIQIERYS